MGGDIFVLIHAGGIIGRLVRFAVEMRCFGPDQPFGGLVGLAHFGGQFLRHGRHALSLHDALRDGFPDMEQKRLFVPPQAIGEHSPGPGIGQNVFNDAFVQFGELMDKAGAGLNVIDLLVVAFPEGFAELRLHLGHAGFPQFIKFQVDLSQKGFQAGNTAVRGQGVQLGRQKGLDAGVRLRRDPGDIFAQGRLPFLELLPGQKADGLIVCQAILPGVLRIEVAYVAPDRFRGPVVFLEHFRR